ncbi:MAG: peptide chain release factor N(5)-glutamine methyltransferase [Candidatus Marinimicrobia bacterium]|nr:peptide chain release factor N(5)-glutamine methyltransferase [Candidatus Neomarinimicrobiota bacterium]
MTVWRVVDIIRSSTEFLEKKGVPDARLDAEMLLGKVLQKNRLELYLYFDRPLEKRELDSYREFIRRRGTREPLQHIVGETGFMNLTLKTGPATLIPRPETEVLVEKALTLTNLKAPRILDIGTGSGCIAIALAQALEDADILAVDISEDALKQARENATLNDTHLTFQLINILNELPDIDTRFDLVVSNPPYIAPIEKDSLQIEVRDFDPHEALFDNHDGLSFYRRYAEILPGLLKPNAYFLFEFGGQPQEKAVLNIFSGNSFHDLEIIQDYNGDPRVICGRYKP